MISTESPVTEHVAPPAARRSTAPDAYDGTDPRADAKLLAELFQELHQTERSAKRHCEREARRLEGTPPASAMRAIAGHADGVLRELSELGTADQGRMPWGQAVGELFTNVRQYAMDRLIESERSYRGTLIGVHHGVDLVRLMLFCAEANGERALAGFCTRWLAERMPLVEQAALAMRWFAEHPDRARMRATAVQS